MWYRSAMTRKVISDSQLRVFINVYGENAVTDMIRLGLLKRIKDPTVIDILLDTKSTLMAALRYREIHNTTFRKAVDMTEKIKEDLDKFKKNKPRRKGVSNEKTRKVQRKNL